MHNENRVSWRLGGPQGKGVDKSATLFAHACARQGMEVFCRREYHSNIMGRHSYFDVTLGAVPLSCHDEFPDVMVTFEAEAFCRHLNSIKAGGHMFHAGDEEERELASLGYLDVRLRNDLEDQLQQAGLPATTSGMLELARRKKIHLHAIPYRQMLSALADELGMPSRRVAPAINTLAVTVSATLLGISRESLSGAVERIFAGQEEVVEMNHRAIDIAHDHAQAHPVLPAIRLPEAQQETGKRLLLNATQSVALGKLAAGMGFQTYYPISPATDESTFLEAHNHVPLAGGEAGGPLLLQVEDELAAINTASGAALTGARCATATSGPGFSLMTEGLGWAGMNEVPLVITLYQRGGPSTGLPTRTDQGDLQTALYGGHGEFPRMVLASGDVENAFYDAAQAFDYAERYQLPVIHLLDKVLTSTLQTVPVFDPSKLQIDRGMRFAPEAGDVKAVPRFGITDSGISPRPVLGQKGMHCWTTGVEHSEAGQVSEDPVVRERMMEKRARKLDMAAREIPTDEKLRIHGDEAADLTLLSWGSSSGAMLDALERLRDQGTRTRAVQVRLLWPFPGAELEECLDSASPLVVLENDYSGQLNALLRQQTGRGGDYLIVKYSGRPVSGEALLPVLQQILAGKAEPRTVLRNPYE